MSNGFVGYVEEAEPIEMRPVDKREELLAEHQNLCAAARLLMKRKNHDYACNDDPFRNFRTFGRYGILVRLSDKLARLQAFEENKSLEVEDETITDTVLDIINYAILYHEYDR